MAMGASQSGATVVKSQKKLTAALLCFIGMLIIGDIDYVTGYQISLLVIYILPVGFATIYVGPRFAILLAILSMAVSIGSDLWAGLPYSEMPIQILNATIALTVFIISIGLLQGLERIPHRRE